jgi:DNA transposition AAA+ family ATPase
MNRPEDMPIDVAEMREWLMAEKDRRSVSWDRLGELVGRSGGTLQPFVKGNYKGDLQAVAQDIYRFRQTVEAQRDRAIGIPADPGFIETPSARRILTLLNIAHGSPDKGGRLTIAATSPGTGKTRAVEHYASCNSNVWVATMEEATKRLNAMLYEVAKAVGIITKFQWSHGLSREIMDGVRNRNGLIVIDEANHLDYAALEQLRSIHDKTGVGLCLLGNEELLQRMRNGLRRDQFARLNSRVAMSHIQDAPKAEDVEAYCDAWELHDAGMRRMLTEIATTPGAGGLRECSMIIEVASMLAVDDGTAISLGHLKEAHSTRATRIVRA